MTEREHFRTSARPFIATKVEILTQTEKGPLISYTRDLSTGGLFVEDAHGLVQNQRVLVRLSTPSSWVPLELSAVVCRLAKDGNNPCGAALKFEDLSQEQSYALSAFLSSLDYGG